MPRKGKGGKRQGSTGKNYPNRTDMANGPRKLPLDNAGLPYGQATALNRAQQGTPNLQQPVPAMPGAAAVGQAQIAPPVSALPTGPPPPALNDPTQNPNEPVTSGIDMGPGVGSSALGIPSDPGIEDMRPWLPALEIISSLPGASMTTKNFVRKIRSAMPYQPPGGVA